MNLLRRFWATVVILVKRLSSQPGLTLAALAGLVIAIALSMSIPVYADSVYYRTFINSVSISLDKNGEPKPEFPFTFRYGLGLNER